jgi:hypothetical protein
MKKYLLLSTLTFLVVKNAIASELTDSSISTPSRRLPSDDSANVIEAVDELTLAYQEAVARGDVETASKIQIGMTIRDRIFSENRDRSDFDEGQASAGVVNPLSASTEVALPTQGPSDKKNLETLRGLASSLFGDEGVSYSPLIEEEIERRRAIIDRVRDNLFPEILPTEDPVVPTPVIPTVDSVHDTSTLDSQEHHSPENLRGIADRLFA